MLPVIILFVTSTRTRPRNHRNNVRPRNIERRHYGIHSHDADTTMTAVYVMMVVTILAICATGAYAYVK